MLDNPTLLDRLWPLLMLSKLFGLSSFPINKRNDGTISCKVLILTCIWSIIIQFLITVLGPLITYGLNDLSRIFLIFLFYYLCFSTESRFISAINQLVRYDNRVEQFKYRSSSQNYSSKWLMLLLSLRLSFGIFPSTYGGLIPVFDWKKLLNVFCSELCMCSFYSIHCTSLFILSDLKERFQNLSYEWYSLILNPSECTPSKLENIRILYSELKEISSSINSVCDRRSSILIALSTLHIFQAAYYWSVNYKDSSTYQYAKGFSRVSNMVLFVLILRFSTDLIGMSMDIVDSLLITPIARLSIECQEQIRFMYECVRMNPLAITVCGFPASSRIWPVVLMEEINIWIASVQLQQELKRISTRTRIQLLNWVIWKNS